MEIPDRPNVGAHLVAFHGAITRAIDVILDTSRDSAKTGTEPAYARNGFADYARTLVTVLDAHHLGEDEVAFPYLRNKVPGAPYDTLHAEHEAILPVLEEIRAAADQAAAGEDEGSALLNLHEATQRLKDLWNPHIAKEENSFSAEILSECMSPAEHVELGQAIAADSQRRLDPPDLALPWVLFNVAPDVRAYLSSAMPPVVIQQLVPIAWKDRWSPMSPFLLT